MEFREAQRSLEGFCHVALEVDRWKHTAALQNVLTCSCHGAPGTHSQRLELGPHSALPWQWPTALSCCSGQRLVNGPGSKKERLKDKTQPTR